MYNPDRSELRGEERDVETTRWDELAEIALKRFPEYGITHKVIEKRLRELKKAGYETGEISGTREKLWGQLEEARNYIRSQASSSTIRRIGKENTERKNQSRDPMLR